MLSGKENIFTCMYTQSVWPTYSKREQKIKKINTGVGAGKEARREEESSAPLCSSSTSTGDPMAVNLKAKDHSLLLVFFFCSLSLPGTEHITDKKWLSVYDMESLYPFGKSPSAVNLFDKWVQEVKSVFNCRCFGLFHRIIEAEQIWSGWHDSKCRCWPLFVNGQLN